jgi:hypothetical protein
MSSHEEAVERDWKTQYVLGELPERERSRFEDHFFDCATCAEGVKTAYLLLRGVEATLKHPIFGAEMEEEAAPVAERTTARAARPWVLRALPIAAMLCLSLGVGVEYVALQRARSPQTVASFSIPPQAKGSTQEIALPATGGFIELEFDLLDVAPQYHWEIKSAGTDRALMSGQAQPPANTVALKLLVPAGRLHPGRYEAVISCPPDHSTVYPFDVAAGPQRQAAP